jgi:hypothetical protein
MNSKDLEPLVVDVGDTEALRATIPEIRRRLQDAQKQEMAAHSEKTRWKLVLERVEKAVQ